MQNAQNLRKQNSQHKFCLSPTAVHTTSFLTFGIVEWANLIKSLPSIYWKTLKNKNMICTLCKTPSILSYFNSGEHNNYFFYILNRFRFPPTRQTQSLNKLKAVLFCIIENSCIQLLWIIKEKVEWWYNIHNDNQMPR